MMPVEPNETERTAEFRMVFLKLVEGAKRLCRWRLGRLGRALHRIGRADAGSRGWPPVACG